jgi:hypothetical protein
MRLIRKRSSSDGRRSEELPVDVPFPFEAKRSWPDLLSEMQASANAAASAEPAADAGAFNDDDCHVIAEGRVQVPVCGGGLFAPHAAAAGANELPRPPERASGMLQRADAGYVPPKWRADETQEQ